MSQKASILLVEDEPFLARVIKDSLEQKGYVVHHAADGDSGYNIFINEQIDLCIADVMLPRMDGFTMVRKMRIRSSQLPVLFLTALTSTKDVIEGYESGGNDYLKKPFSLDELFLRIRELLKRSTISHREKTMLIGGYIFSPHSQSLQFGNDPGIKLSHRESQLLQLLYEHKNGILERKQALVRVWGDDSFFNARSMDVFITKLRKRLIKDVSIEIINVRGVGYKLVER